MQEQPELAAVFREFCGMMGNHLQGFEDTSAKGDATPASAGTK